MNKQMKKIELIKLTMFSLILSISLIITSCEQDPVTPPEEQPYQFDSARFQWTEYPTPEGSAFDHSIFIADTNNVFVSDYFFKNGVMIISNGSYRVQYFPWDYNIMVLTGGDINSTYLFGMEKPAPGKFSFAVWKYNGVEFIKYQSIPLDTRIRFNDAYYHNPNEIWLCGNEGNIMRYNGNEIKSYKFSDSIFFETIKKCKNEIIVTGPQFTEDFETINNIYYYDRSNDSFELIYKKYPPEPDYLNGFPRLFENEIIGPGYNEYYIFDGKKFVFYLSTNEIFRGWDCHGLSSTNFFAEGIQNIQNITYGLFHWDGRRWSNEGMRRGGTGSGRMYNKDFSVYARGYGGGAPTGVLIGKRKK